MGDLSPDPVSEELGEHIALAVAWLRGTAGSCAPERLLAAAEALSRLPAPPQEQDAKQPDLQDDSAARRATPETVLSARTLKTQGEASSGGGIRPAVSASPDLPPPSGQGEGELREAIAAAVFACIPGEQVSWADWLAFVEKHSRGPASSMWKDVHHCRKVADALLTGPLSRLLTAERRAVEAERERDEARGELQAIDATLEPSHFKNEFGVTIRVAIIQMLMEDLTRARARATAAEARVEELRRGISDALDLVAYVPGDCPVVPWKHDRFVNDVRSLSDQETRGGAPRAEG